MKKCEVSRSADSTSSLIKKPPSGGIPLIEKIRKEKRRDRKGLLFFSSAK